MNPKDEKPKLTNEQEKLINSYKRFSSYMIKNLLSSGTQNENDYLEITKFLKRNKDQIEIPLFLICKDYYEDGCKTMQIGFFFDFIFSAIFGASIGLLATLLSDMPNYWIYALIAAIICLAIAIIYSVIKKMKSRV